MASADDQRNDTNRDVCMRDLHAWMDDRSVTTIAGSWREPLVRRVPVLRERSWCRSWREDRPRGSHAHLSLRWVLARVGRHRYTYAL